MTNKDKEKLLEYMINGELGISSKTLISAVLDIPCNHADIPYDTSDFGRCYKVCFAVPAVLKHLDKVAQKYPKWNPIIRIWDKLSVLYSKGDYKGVYAELKAVRDECMEADGYIKTADGCWSKGNSAVITIKV